MSIIDFDARFTEVLNKWIEENRHRFRRPEEMEDEVLPKPPTQLPPPRRPTARMRRRRSRHG